MTCKSLLLSAALCPAVLAGQGIVGATVSAPEVVSVGTGEVLVSPDRVQLTVAVSTRGSSASEAGRANADRMSRVLAALRRQGLADSVLTTSGYAVDEEQTYDGERRDPPVYVARNAIGVFMTELGELGSIIDSALAAGATSIDQIRFQSSRESEARDRALELAVQSARREAQIVASAAGGTLGPVIELTIDPGYSTFSFGMESGVNRLSQVVVTRTPLAPSDVRVAVRVRVRSVLGAGSP